MAASADVRLVRALSLPEARGERARAAASVLHEILWPEFERTWKRPVPALGGLSVDPFGGAVYWVSHQHGFYDGVRHVVLPEARRLDAVDHAVAEGGAGALPWALFAALNTPPGAQRKQVRKQDGIVRDIARVLMVEFLACKGLARTRQRVDEDTREDEDTGEAPAKQTAYRTATDAVALGEALAKQSLAALKEAIPAGRSRAVGTVVYVMELLVAYTPNLEAVDGILDRMVEEIPEVVRTGPEGAIVLGEEFAAAVERLSDAVPVLKANASRLRKRRPEKGEKEAHETYSSSGEMKEFFTLLNILSRYRPHLS